MGTINYYNIIIIWLEYMTREYNFVVGPDLTAIKIINVTKANKWNVNNEKNVFNL